MYYSLASLSKHKEKRLFVLWECFDETVAVRRTKPSDHFPPPTALCKDDPNANVPLGKSCERYWACQGGYPRLQRCPATLVFDKLSRRCVNPPTADCEAPTTTPAPEELGPFDTGDRALPARPPPRRRPLPALSEPQDQGGFIPNNALRPSDARPLGPLLPQGGNFREAPIDKAVPLN